MGRNGHRARRLVARVVIAVIADAAPGLGWSAQAVAQEIVLAAAQAVDGRGQRIDRPRILVRDGRIVAMTSSPAGRAPTPAGATMIDLGGYTVLPGLIDAHVHITRHFGDPGETASLTALFAAGNARSLLDSGFTTVRSLGSEGFVGVDLREAIRRGVVPGPRLLVSGEGLTDAIAPGAQGDAIRRRGVAAAGEAAIRGFVRDQARGGVDWLKIFATRSSRAGGTVVYSQAQLDWAIDEASRASLPVAVHAHSAEGARRAILAGARTIEHGALLDDAVLDLMARRGTYYSPNLYLGEHYLAHGDRFGFSREALEWTRKLLPARTEVFRKAVSRGVRIVHSTDAVAGWISSGDTAVEFERRVSAGQPAAQAIVGATTLAAEALGLGRVVGDLQPGMAADIIAVDGNPLSDIGALRRVVFVMRGGVVHKRPD